MIPSVIKRGQVQVAATRPERPVAPAAEATPQHAKHVQPLRVDGVVRALEITCTCGETIVVELEYSNPKENPR